MAFGDLVRSVKASIAADETAITFTAPTLGNLCIVSVGRSSTHTAGGAWSDPLGARIHDSGINVGNMGAAWWYFISDGTETAFTCTDTNEQGNAQILLCEYEGPFAASPLDVSAEDASNLSTVVTSQSSGTTGTTAQADALAVAMFAFDRMDLVDGSRTYSNSFTESAFNDGSTARAGSMQARKVLSATGTVECTFSCTDTGDEMYGSVAVFKKAASGTTYNQSADGATTPAGTILKSTSKLPAGTVTSAGALLKSAGKTLVGAFTPSGDLSKLTSKIFSGELTPTGALTTVRLYIMSVTGTLTSSGSIFKDTTKAFTGSITPSGALSKLTDKPLAGTLTSSGALTVVKTFVVAVGGTLTSAGALIKDTAKAFAGTLTQDGSVNKLISKILSGEITPSGALTIIRTFLVSLGGTLTSSGALLKSTAKSFTGSLTPSGGISKAIEKIIAGVLSFVGTLTSSGGGAPVEPVEQTFSPLDLDACFGNEKDLSAYGGETPDGIPGWVADPSADPTAPTFEPLDLDECISAGKSLSVYSS